MKACMLPDYASQPCDGRVLERVGVHDIKIPMIGIGGAIVPTKQSLYVELSGKNGAHMSRLVAIIEDQCHLQIDTTIVPLTNAITSHGADKAFYEITWEDNIICYMDEMRPTYLSIPMTLEGALIAGKSVEWFLTFEFPYASVCPCSAEMTKSQGFGHPHMQRATATVTIQLTEDLKGVPELMNRITQNVGLIPISFMKREDELRWCQQAEKHNLFVEDAARAIGNAIEGFLVSDWVVVCEHEESIHQHNVVAVCRKGGRLS